MQAKEIVEKRAGMATRLLYQLFIALGKKTKMNLTGAAMETMRPEGPARLEAIESDMYKEVNTSLLYKVASTYQIARKTLTFL